MGEQDYGFISNIDRFMPTARDVDDAVAAARAALLKHGPPTTDPVRASAELAEEVVEVIKEALAMTSPNLDRRCSQPFRDRLLLMREEVAQTAGFALLILRQIDLEGYEPTK